MARRAGGIRPVTADLGYLRLGIVNCYFFGPPHAVDRGWVLIDAGLRGTAGRIARAAARRFGDDARPAAIILTHGHFDHVGGLPALAERWDVPVYAHPLELPYLTGASAYPPPDPAVGGGAMAALSWLYPSEPVDLRGLVRPLPADRSVPGMPGWHWIHTPGHSPGHVSLFRHRDRLLLSGDAVITTRQESAVAVLRQHAELHGPPAYFTPDWTAARQSVRRLAGLWPATVASGHGPPLGGDSVPRALQRLADGFDREVPGHGRYVGHPALTDERGLVMVPPPAPRRRRLLFAALGAAALGGVLYAASHRPAHG